MFTSCRKKSPLSHRQPFGVRLFFLLSKACEYSMPTCCSSRKDLQSQQNTITRIAPHWRLQSPRSRNTPRNQDLMVMHKVTKSGMMVEAVIGGVQLEGCNWRGATSIRLSHVLLPTPLTVAYQLGREHCSRAVSCSRASAPIYYNRAQHSGYQTCFVLTHSDHCSGLKG